MDMGRGEEKLRCRERVTWKLPSPYKIDRQQEFAVYLKELKQGLCDKLEGGVGRRFKREGTYVHLWLIHVDVWQKTTKFYKAIILQLKSK